MQQTRQQRRAAARTEAREKRAWMRLTMLQGELEHAVAFGAALPEELQGFDWECPDGCGCCCIPSCHALTDAGCRLPREERPPLCRVYRCDKWRR